MDAIGAVTPAEPLVSIPTGSTRSQSFQVAVAPPDPNAVVELLGRSEIDDIDLDGIDPGTLQFIHPVSPSELRGKHGPAPSQTKH